MPSSAVVSFLLGTHWALPTLNYLISIVLNHPHKLSGALKLSSAVSDGEGGGRGQEKGVGGGGGGGDGGGGRRRERE